jgi:hypothetical protein
LIEDIAKLEIPLKTLRALRVGKTLRVERLKPL